jgi:hypothetical protein
MACWRPAVRVRYPPRGVSSGGRAPESHSGGQRFESATLHVFFGGLAQVVERQHGMLKASGSSPLPSTGERCRSGRTGTTGNRVVRQKRARGFESPPLRLLWGARLWGRMSSSAGGTYPWLMSLEGFEK